MSLFACVFLLNDLLMFVCLLCLQLLLPSGSPKAGVWSSQIFRLMVTLYTSRERATRRRTWWSSCIRWDVCVCVCVCVVCVCVCVCITLLYCVTFPQFVTRALYVSSHVMLLLKVSVSSSRHLSSFCHSPFQYVTVPQVASLFNVSPFSMCHSPSQCVTLPLNTSTSLNLSLSSMCPLSLSVSLSWLRLSVPWRTVHPGHWSEEVPPAGGVHGRGHSSSLCCKVPLTAEDPFPDLSTK